MRLIALPSSASAASSLLLLLLLLLLPGGEGGPTGTPAATEGGRGNVRGGRDPTLPEPTAVPAKGPGRGLRRLTHEGLEDVVMVVQDIGHVQIVQDADSRATWGAPAPAPASAPWGSVPTWVAPAPASSWVAPAPASSWVAPAAVVPAPTAWVTPAAPALLPCEPEAHYPDRDGDHFGDAFSPPSYQCPPGTQGGHPQTWSQPPWYGTIASVTNNDDCDDYDFHTNPNGAEICNDGKSNTCGSTINVDSDYSVCLCLIHANGALTLTSPGYWYIDADSDGYGSRSSLPLRACAAPTGYVADNTDCDDTNGGVNPGTPSDICNNGIDDNCDNLGDADLTCQCPTGEPTLWFLDTDQNGVGDVNSRYFTCGELPLVGSYVLACPKCGIDVSLTCTIAPTDTTAGSTGVCTALNTDAGIRTCTNGQTVTRMSFRYKGGTCLLDDNDQGGESSCIDAAGGPTTTTPVTIVAEMSVSAGNVPQQVFSGDVALEGTFFVDLTTIPTGNLNELTITISQTAAGGGALLQTLNFHWACDQTLTTCDNFGALEVVDYTQNGVLYSSEAVATYASTVTAGGGVPGSLPAAETSVFLTTNTLLGRNTFITTTSSQDMTVDLCTETSYTHEVLVVGETTTPAASICTDEEAISFIVNNT